jgi:hypothetical protein
MTRSDGIKTAVCTGCGTIPVYNEKLGLAVCTLCSGPVSFTGSSRDTIEMIPPAKKGAPEIVQVEMPYATKLFSQELGSFLNMGMRFLTTSGMQRLKVPMDVLAGMTGAAEGSSEPLPERILPDMNVPEIQEGPIVTSVEDLTAIANTMGMTVVPMAVVGEAVAPEAQEVEAPVESAEPEVSLMPPTSPMPPMPPVLQGALPGSDDTIVIDTSEPAMRSEGIEQNQRRTLRFAREPREEEQGPEQDQFGGAATTVKVIKLG